MELMELNCKKCGAPIQSEDINLDLGMARCTHCGTVFSLKGLPQERAPDKPTTNYPRAAVAMPKRIEIFDSGDGLRIQYHWFSPKYIFMIIFTVFWNGFMLVWHGIALSSGAWFMSLFGLLHTAVGLGLGYSTLAGFLNTTTIWVGLDFLEIRHHPLPWPGSKRLLAEEIEQIYCKENVSQSRNGGASYSYEVYAILRNAAKEKLLGGLNEVEQALYIEQELERYMRIQDRPVRGEIPR
jgi:hypothetical protein